jgi:hypothetical protein
VQQDGVVTLAVDPAVWLDQADLTGVADPTADEYVLVARDDVAHAAFARGLKKATAYLFSFSV